MGMSSYEAPTMATFPKKGSTYGISSLRGFVSIHALVHIPYQPLRAAGPVASKQPHSAGCAVLLGYLVQVEWIISFVMMRFDRVFHSNFHV